MELCFSATELALSLPSLTPSPLATVSILALWPTWTFVLHFSSYKVETEFPFIK